jgi:hypothetical protein
MENTIFALHQLESGRYAVTERLEGSRFVKFVATLDTYAEALAWIGAATDSDYFETGLIFPSLVEVAYVE